MKQKATRGGLAGGAIPPGYVPDLRGGITVDETAAGTIRYILQMRKNGLSLRTIAKNLN